MTKATISPGKPPHAISSFQYGVNNAWRQGHVERVRRRLDLRLPVIRSRTVERLDRAEVERLIAAAYRDGSRRGLMVKTLFLTGARVSEFVHIRVEDLHLDDDPPRIHLAHANRSVPILPTLGSQPHPCENLR